MDVDDIIRMVDINGNGTIDYSEWLVATMDRDRLLTDDRLKIAFDFFDKDKNGQIDIHEIKEAIGSKRSFVEDRVWQSIMI